MTITYRPPVALRSLDPMLNPRSTLDHVGDASARWSGRRAIAAIRSAFARLTAPDKHGASPRSPDGTHSTHLPARTRKASDGLPKNVADVMTRHVISVSPNMLVREVAETLVHNCISAAPVLDRHGRLVGIVSESDLLRRGEIATESPRRWWSDIVGDASAAAFRYVKSYGREARHVMTPRPMTVIEETSLGELVSLFEKRGVKRFPVVRGDQLVGIVSRADLVRALAESPERNESDDAPNDRQIEKDVITRISSLSSLRGAVLVTAQDGVVVLRGLISSDLEREAAHVAARNTPGVREVQDDLLFRVRSAV